MSKNSSDESQLSREPNATMVALAGHGHATGSTVGKWWFSI